MTSCPDAYFFVCLDYNYYFDVLGSQAGGTVLFEAWTFFVGS